MEKINIAVVGLNFGRHFAEIYKSHPNVNSVGIYDADIECTRSCSECLGISKTYKSFEEILADENVDAVHLLTPIPLHADQTVKILESGKHCACAVPMATSLEDIQRITDAVRKSGKKYMMMETMLYSYHFLYVSEMLKNEEIGKIQFMRGSHYQDMSNWPGYWMGLPPMYYGTHAIGPMTALSGSRIKRVVCFGSGTMADELVQNHGNPFPVESALLEFENGLKGEVTRSLFETARCYQEGFSVYGSKKSFEFGFGNADNPYVTKFLQQKDAKKRGIALKYEQVELPDYCEVLPKELYRFTNGSHHGSHPHLVNEFVMSIIENRKPYIDEILGGNICAAGICAHTSAMNDGENVIVPVF